MELTDEEKQTIASYDTNAKVWAKSRNIKKFWLEEKEKFKKYLPQGKVIEIGSGGGRDSIDLMKMGYEYVGTDISKGLLNEAKKNNPSATFLQQSVYDLITPPKLYDGFWACAVLLHIPKKRMDEALKSIYKVIKKNGVGFISLKKGKRERFVKGDHAGIDYKRFFSFWDKNEFSLRLKENKFEILESYELIHSHRPWLVFFVKVL